MPRRSLFKDEIATLVVERFSLQAENEKLKEGLNDLSASKHADGKKINQLEKDLEEAQSFVIEQHQLGFSKSLQQAEYFYKIPLNTGNFDVQKDFYNDNLIPIGEIPYEEGQEEEAANDDDAIVDVE